MLMMLACTAPGTAAVAPAGAAVAAPPPAPIVITTAATAVAAAAGTAPTRTFLRMFQNSLMMIDGPWMDPETTLSSRPCASLTFRLLSDERRAQAGRHAASHIRRAAAFKDGGMGLSRARAGAPLAGGVAAGTAVGSVAAKPTGALAVVPGATPRTGRHRGRSRPGRYFTEAM
ncbi:hypothetical protein NBH00_23655 [Paraconexibacter antarcticus]|uniref:Secreted protein n=1 Tax=Paraconexibacter antarcticus TaxID=2949664 RepID=A0ABY5DTM5_9ACTN|nr:hypothetical protein [Paraconexibacter antarcticus]UTI64321.1 hypothetical protein NBH00_23655 [Paraconexibacter antarcticus]